MTSPAAPAKSKEYHRPMPATWWLRNRQLTLFMLRELTSVFVAAYAVFLLVLIAKANQGLEPFNQFVADVLKSPVSVVLHLIALAFVLYHSITWFNLTPKAMVLWRGEERVSPVLIAGAHYALCIVLSIIVLILVLS